MINIKEKLEATLHEIESKQGIVRASSETKAILLVAKASVLIALQKYEDDNKEYED